MCRVEEFQTHSQMKMKKRNENANELKFGCCTSTNTPNYTIYNNQSVVFLSLFIKMLHTTYQFTFDSALRQIKLKKHGMCLVCYVYVISTVSNTIECVLNSSALPIDFKL